MPCVTRFAPSPSGRLHLGHAHSALFAERAAQEGNGRFLLRIEDIDIGRCRPEFEGGILEDLSWLGLTWEEPVLRQSQRFDAYRDALHRLTNEGLTYPCFCTRKEIATEIAEAGRAPHGPDGPLYPGTCRHLSRSEATERIANGATPAIRLKMDIATAQCDAKLGFTDLGRGPLAARPERFGDIVLARKDVPTSYHLAVTVDDALQDISLITRGEDLLEATDVHVLLQQLLGYSTPTYHHHALIRGPDGKRLAKRDKAETIEAMRQNGKTPAEVRVLAGFPD